MVTKVIVVKYIEEKGTFPYTGWIVARPMALRGEYTLYEFSDVCYTNVSNPDGDELVPGDVIEVQEDAIKPLIPHTLRALLGPEA